MKVLVTGGAGFIGSHTLDALRARGDTTALLDDFNDFYDPAVKRRNASATGAQIFDADLRDRPSVRAALQSFRPDAILHLAARAGIRASIQNPQLYVETNINGTLNLLDEALALGITRPACTELAARLGVGDRLRFLGFQRDPGPLYRAADLAVLASKAESLSNFLIESQAHGLPVVAADARGVSECIQPGVTGEVVPAGDIPAHRVALLPYLENPDLRARAGQAAMIFARQAFEPTRQARAYLDLFEKLRK